MIKESTKQILGSNFFLEEVRCDFLVPEKMKHIWAVEIDLYLEFARICEKYNLVHYVFYGTILGAIRHHGFIPWDDDFDVAMPRKDFELFLKYAPKELSHPYFLQTPYSDPGCYLTLPRLRNSSTTGMIKTFSHNTFNQGIWLDIDVLDECDPRRISEDRAVIHNHIMRCATYMRKDSPLLDSKRKSELIDYYTDNPLHDFEEIDRIASNPKYRGLPYLTAATSTPYSPEKQTFKKEWFSSSIDVKFESIKVKVPIGYDNILKTTYGNYMEFPPLEKRKVWHGGNFFDPFRPYTDYIRQIK